MRGIDIDKIRLEAYVNVNDIHIYYQMRMYSFYEDNSFVTAYMYRMEGHSDFLHCGFCYSDN